MSQRSQALEAPAAPAQAIPLTPEAGPGEDLSALWDGESSALGLLGQTVGGPEELADARLSRWREYHLIGSVLREGGACEAPADLAFARSVMARVQAEPGFDRPSPAAWQGLASERSVAVPAANDSVFRWKALASVASLVAVASMGWQWAGDAATGARLASATPAAVSESVAVSPAPAAGNPAGPDAAAGVWVQTAAGPMWRDPQLEALMAAHRQLGGVSALQMPAGFVRNATFELPAR